MWRICNQLIQVLALTTVISCNLSDKDATLAKEDIYMAGIQYVEAEHWAATYWKNGNPTFLTDGTKDAAAYAVTVYENNIYVAGEEDHQLKYWKNGIAVTLTPEQNGNSARCNGITVIGNDVYVAGYITNSVGVKVAMVWKNGEGIELSSGIQDAMANSVGVLNQDVYVAGYENIGIQASQKAVAVYWKNKTVNILSNGKFDARAESVMIVDGNVYITGNEFLDKEYNRYWKNGKATELSNEFKKALSWRQIFSLEKTILGSWVMKNGKDIPLFSENDAENRKRYFFDLFVVNK